MEYQLLSPPYTRCHGLPTSFGRGPLPRGSIISLRPTAATSWELVRSCILDTQQRFASCPVALNVSGLGNVEQLRFVSNARAVCVRGFIVEDTPAADLLRLQICDGSDLDTCVLHWLRLRGPSIDAEIAETLRRFVNQPADRRLLDVADGETALLLHWRRRFLTSGIGSIGRWHRILRILSIAATVQGNPNASLTEIALWAGFAEATSLSRACSDTLGARPSDLRKWIGWQYPFATALARSGLTRAWRLTD